MSKKENKFVWNKDKIFTIIGIALCVILIPMLIFNIIMIINSNTGEDDIPNVGKYVPFIVKSESMEDEIYGGSIIMCEIIKDPKDLPKDMIITFYDSPNGTTTTTHRIIDKELREDGKWYYQTKGDNNNAADPTWVCEDKIIAEYLFAIPVIGHISLFMSTTPGLIVCVFCPLALLIGYDVIRRKMYDKANKQDTDALLAELEALKAEKAKLQSTEESTEEVVEETKEESAE